LKFSEFAKTTNSGHHKSMAKRPHDSVDLAKGIFDIAGVGTEDTVSELKRHLLKCRAGGLKGEASPHHS
jgi:hypothetical protein